MTLEPRRDADQLGSCVIELAEVGGTMAVCEPDGRIAACSPSARTLLIRLGVEMTNLPAPLPPLFWQLLGQRAIGEPVQWRGVNDHGLLLGCTRYRLGAERWLLIMSEISQKQSLLAQRLHQQRLESLGRLVATTVHDLRSPLSSIVFNSDVLAERVAEMSPERAQETAVDIRIAAHRLRGTIDCFLDYVRIGPSTPTEVSIHEVLSRTQTLLRPTLRAGHHQLIDAVGESDRVLGNPIAIEQIFVNLVLNALEAADRPITVRVSTTARGAMIDALVEDDGPGIPVEHRLQVFDPFFTTKRGGTGIGLSSSREAARDAGGELELVHWVGGAAFRVSLPRSSGPTEAP